MTPSSAILKIIERGARRQHVARDATSQLEDDILELKPEFIAVEPKPDQFRADEFHLVLNRHRLAHTKVRYKQLTSGAT